MEHNAGIQSEIAYTPKLTNMLSRKTVSLTTFNYLLQEFIDNKAIILFCNKLQSSVAVAGGYSEHSF